MFEGFILGAIQGITEWLPISSEGATVLAYKFLFNSENLSEAIKFSLFLHLGTFVASFIYLRKDVYKILGAFLSFSESTDESKILLKFLLIATTVSGVLGVLIFKFIGEIEQSKFFTGQAITFLVGLALLVTAFLQIRARNDDGARSIKSLSMAETLFLGFVQGLSALPGISRSGITVSTLLLKNFHKEKALKISFLMGLPIVLSGNILLNLGSFSFSAVSLWGLLFSFVFGLATINILFKVARKINFGYFVLFFAVLVVASAFI